jgi:hypothetical protein
MASSASTSQSLVAIQPREDRKENCPDATIDGGNRYRSERLKLLLNADSSRLGQGKEREKALDSLSVAFEPQISRTQRVV